VTLVLYLFITSNRYKFVTKLKNNNVVKFIGSSTLWIYLWHWLFIKISTITFGEDIHYLLKFIVVYSSSLVTVYLQRKLIAYLCEIDNLSVKTNIFLTKAFTG
jgi:peptidoglycan/LPS O-acetylase OafA/YrhL